MQGSLGGSGFRLGRNSVLYFFQILWSDMISNTNVTRIIAYIHRDGLAPSLNVEITIFER